MSAKPVEELVLLRHRILNPSGSAPGVGQIFDGKVQLAREEVLVTILSFLEEHPNLSAKEIFDGLTNGLPLEQLKNVWRLEKEVENRDLKEVIQIG